MTLHAAPPDRTDVLVVGAGPAGSAAAAWAARAGHEVTLLDAKAFPRDKTCGDGLTPRAIAEIQRLGLLDFLEDRPEIVGLRAAGYGRTWHLPWPGGSLPAVGSVVPREELDTRLAEHAAESGARVATGWRALDVGFDGARVGSVQVAHKDTVKTVQCRRVIVADGVKSPIGTRLGRVWHRDTAFGVAARAYVKSEVMHDQWITAHLELRTADNNPQSGYGWLFPIGGGEYNIGVGAMQTAARPASVNLRRLLQRYYDQRKAGFRFTSSMARVRSAMLPMGGAVSNVAGPNWMLIGDAAACINPLNGEGIDYGMETGRVAVELMAETDDYLSAWPALLQHRYGTAFSGARRLAQLLTHPDFLRVAGPLGMRSRRLMGVALRVMGNFITPEDDDALARLAHLLGSRSWRSDTRVPFS